MYPAQPIGSLFLSGAGSFKSINLLVRRQLVFPPREDGVENGVFTAPVPERERLHFDGGGLRRQEVLEADMRGQRRGVFAIGDEFPEAALAVFSLVGNFADHGVFFLLRFVNSSFKSSTNVAISSSAFAVFALYAPFVSLWMCFRSPPMRRSSERTRRSVLAETRLPRPRFRKNEERGSPQMSDSVKRKFCSSFVSRREMMIVRFSCAGFIVSASTIVFSIVWAVFGPIDIFRRCNEWRIKSRKRLLF